MVLVEVMVITFVEKEVVLVVVVTVLAGGRVVVVVVEAVLRTVTVETRVTIDVVVKG
jgi:hypothetical protein